MTRRVRVVLSAAKLRANRRNALASTGPRTPQGLARASRNNLDHGILSATTGLLVPGEHSAAWRSHLCAVVANLAPDGVYVETLLAGRVAWALWRQGRCDRYIAARQRAMRADAKGDAEKLWMAAFDRGGDSRWTAKRLREFAIMPREVARVFTYERELGAEIVRLTHELRRMRRARKQRASSGFEAKSPEVRTRRRTRGPS